VRLATRQPESLMHPHVTSWSCQPGQSANLAEVVWHPVEAALHPRTTVIEHFSSDRDAAPLSSGQSVRTD